MSKVRLGPRIKLIPWDHTSAEHLDRMYKQRVACGWRSDEIEKWKTMSEEGRKVLYWIALCDDCPGRDDLLGRHASRYPDEATPLTDTASAPWNTVREPPNTTFTPVGHIALDLRPEENESLGFPSIGPVWVAGLYISWALQSTGLGKAAMVAAEALSALPPLNGDVILLDSMPADQQMLPAFLDKVYIQQRNPAPTVATETWYRALGYEHFRRQEAGYMWLNPQTGIHDPMAIVYFSKKLQRPGQDG